MLQEESTQRMEKVTQKMEKSKKDFKKLWELTFQQSGMIEECIKGQRKNEKSMENLLREREEDREIMKKTQVRLDQILEWIQMLETGREEKQEGRATKEMITRQVTPGKNKRSGNNL